MFEKVTSKSTLKKCKKGLHEYKLSKLQISKGFFKSNYTCIHCLTEMKNNL